MPKIPLYEQGRLASSLVGTPGVDNSGQIMAESVATGLSQLNTALAYKQRQTLAAQKELETLQRNAMAGERVSAISLKKTMIANDLKAKHMYDPDVGEVELNKQLDKLLEDEVAGIQDPMLKALVKGKGFDEIVAEKKEYSNFKLSRAVPIMEKSLEAQSGDLAFRVRSAVDPETGRVDRKTVTGVIEDFNNRTSGVMANLYGPAAVEKNRQAVGDALTGMLFEVAARGPQGTDNDAKFADYLKEVYEDPQFNAYIDPKEGKQILVEARRIYAEASRAKEEQNRMVQADTDLRVGETITAAQLSGADASVYRKMYADAKANGASPAVLSSIRSLEVGLYKKATGEAKAEGKVKLEALTNNLVVKSTTLTKTFFTRFKESKNASPVNPYKPNEGIKALRDYNDAVAKTIEAQTRYTELTGKQSQKLADQLVKLQAVGRKVTTSQNLKNQTGQYEAFAAAMPSPRFAGSAAIVAAKKKQYNRLRDQAFIDAADKGKIDTLQNPKTRQAINTYILKQMGAL